ncbi:tumor protein D54 [Elysia marginata]|uniref:Tumor protein D54 n=1 Tax=Elysia marginata TaxID=1093978 RepID=A0AAV4H767_9GAST|nr:tumor protein D54 [Elysia marginata]
MASSPSDDALYGSDKGDNFEVLSSPTSDVDEATTPSSDGPINETPEEREARLAALREELEKIESEISMLRQCLGAKVRLATEIKRKLGITPFQEFKQDLQTGILHIKSSDSYQKTNDTIQQLNDKIAQTQANSQTFKSFDEKMHTTYASVKAKVTGSRSSGEIDAAFRDATVPQGDESGAPGSPERADEALPEEKVPL